MNRSSRGHKSHLWNLAFPKLHFTRDSRRPTVQDSSDEFHSLGSETLVDSIDDQKDGFYRYSESILEEEAQFLAAQRARPLSEDSIESFVVSIISCSPDLIPFMKINSMNTTPTQSCTQSAIRTDRCCMADGTEQTPHSSVHSQ